MAYNRHADGQTTLIFVVMGREAGMDGEGGGWPMELKGVVLSEVDRQRLIKSEKKSNWAGSPSICLRSIYKTK